jgi:hypothetical protein
MFYGDGNGFKECGMTYIFTFLPLKEKTIKSNLTRDERW